MAERSEWHRPHFESLGHVGVWARGGHGCIFPAQRCPVLQSRGYITSLQTTTDQSTLTTAIQAAVPADGFLSGVRESVKDLTITSFGIFFLTPMTYCAINDQRMYVLASACQVQVVKQSCARLMETAYLRGILVLIGHMQRFPMHITGQICLPTWHISCAHVLCALHPKVRINCVWGQNLSHPSHFNLSPLGLWIG